MLQNFVKLVGNMPTSQINIQREEFKRFGVIGDWEHPYLTMDFKYEANIIRSLAKIIARIMCKKAINLCTGVWIALLHWQKQK